VKRLTSALALALLTASIVLTSAGAAQAVAAFPPTDTFYAIPCNADDVGLKRVNPADSTWVSVGSQTTVGTVDCGYQPASNPARGASYFLGGNTENGEWPLVQIDTATGNYTVVHEIWDGTTNLNFFSDPANFPGSMFITNTGTAYLVAGTKLYPLNLDTAVIGPQIGSDLVVGGDIYATACSPVSAVCYILTELGSLYTIEPTTGVVSWLGILPTIRNYSLQVASDGTLWSSSRSGHIASFSAADPEGTYDDGPETPLYSGAYLITYAAAAPVAAPVTAPSLANSGVESAAPAIAASVLLAVGGILVVMARRRRAV